MTQTSQAAIASVLEQLDREVWVITSADGERRGGLVATWVSPASIDERHPVLLAGIAPNHFTAELIDRSRTFAAHLLRTDQFPVAWNFCRDSGRERDKLAELAVCQAGSGSPRLVDCLAWLDCRVFARVATGDRIYYWADVLDGFGEAQGPAMRERDLLAAATTEQKQHLAERRQQDIQWQHPAWQQWRNQMPADQQLPPREP